MRDIGSPTGQCLPRFAQYDYNEFERFSLIRLGLLETIAFVVEARDTTGGSGANLIVDWLAVESVDEPVIEAVMVASAGSQGISLRAPGKNLSASDASE